MIEIRPSDVNSALMLLRTQQTFAASRDDVFSFFADAANLESITPPWLRFRILTPLPIDMNQGALIDYQLRLHGFPIRWRTEICEWEPPFRFADRQLRGPYRLWHHTHTFEEVSDGTLMTDEVEYAVPGGQLVNRWFVERDLQRIFMYRREQLAQRYAVGDPVSS